ncbi:MAG: hypothetical protein ACKVU2_11135 [Saprospiraceae bacterium]
MTLVDQIRDMISAGETEKSLEELYKFVKENNADIIDNLVMLRSRMQSVERAVNVGTMSSQEATLEKAKINDAILKLLPQLTPEYLAEASKRKSKAAYAPPIPQRPAQQSNKLYFIIGGAVLALVLLIWSMSGGDSEATSDLAQGEQLVEQADDGQGQPETAKLASLLAANGTAVWVASVNHLDDTGVSSFAFQDNTTCSEFAYGDLLSTWKVVENVADYVTIYDAETGQYMRIYVTTAEVRNGETGEWKIYYNGAWK